LSRRPSSSRAVAPAEIRRLIRGNKSFLITGHERPDGDCLGAELALAALLRAMGKKAVIVNHDPLPPPYDLFFDSLGEFRTCRRDAAGQSRRRPARPIPADVVFVLDSTDMKRVGDPVGLFPPGAVVVNIDHHVSNERFGDLYWVDGRMSSVGEMIWILARGGDGGARRLPLPRAAAIGLYVGIITDTGQFAYSNTTPLAHRIAAELIERGVRPNEINRKLYYRRCPEELILERRALGRLEITAGGRVASVSLTLADLRAVGVGPEHAHELANIPRALDGVRVALFFCEMDGRRRGKGAKISTKVSLRTAPGLDANRIAAAFGGGGHLRAAGCEIPGRLARAKRLVYAEVGRHLRKKKRRGAKKR